MAITLQRLNASNRHYTNQIDPLFMVEAVIHLHAEDGQISYTVTPVAPYEKRYDRDDLDVESYLRDPDKAIYFAFVDGELAGQIVLNTWWNNYAYLQDIVVNQRFRRMGIAAALIQQASEWARSKGLPGIMLETQNNNVAACCLYEKMGFTLAGFDRMLYRALHPDSEEIALYWYLML